MPAYGNPLKGILEDRLFTELLEKGFLNERAVRDHYIKQRFAQLKNQYKPKDAFRIIQKEFPYLSVDTVRKIVYSRGPSANGHRLS